MMDRRAAADRMAAPVPGAALKLQRDQRRVDGQNTISPSENIMSFK